MTHRKLAKLEPRVATLNTAVTGQRYSELRGTAAQRGYTYRWQRYRISWLRDHPLCGDRVDGRSDEHSLCTRDGLVTPATDVDHIDRVTGPDDPRFWDPTNHQSLCHACHSTKTAQGL